MAKRMNASNIQDDPCPVGIQYRKGVESQQKADSTYHPREDSARTVKL
jgi:hypothetical protein